MADTWPTVNTGRFSSSKGVRGMAHSVSAKAWPGRAQPARAIMLPVVTGQAASAGLLPVVISTLRGLAASASGTRTVSTPSV